jgi:DNA mismatch endonuclease, patch repair protein
LHARRQVAFPRRFASHSCGGLRRAPAAVLEIDLRSTFPTMPERFTIAERSRVMAAVKSVHTKPELLVRKIVSSMGWRYRLHRRDLPGTPDIVFSRLGKVINVNGCFWHLHRCRHGQKAPVRNADYWQAKRLRNAARDVKTNRQLRRAGWRVLTLWECQLQDVDKVAERIARFLGPAPAVVKSGRVTKTLRRPKPKK